MKGVLLVGAAVVLGIVLLQVVDDGSSGPVAEPVARDHDDHRVDDDDDQGNEPDDHDHEDHHPVKKPAQIKLLVLNAGAPTGSAATVSDDPAQQGLHEPGHSRRTIRTTGPASRCCVARRSSREAATLAVLLGTGTTKAALGNPGPPGSTGYDCVVLIGS